MAENVVDRYAAAKSCQDVEAALALCEPDFTIETIPFGLASTNRADTADQLRLFFSVFPDYRAETEGLARNEDTVAWWGRISVTFEGDFLGLSSTGRTATLPAFSVFDLRGDRLVREWQFQHLSPAWH